MLFTKMKNVGGVGFGSRGEAGRGSQDFGFGCVKLEIRHPSRGVQWSDCIYESGFQGRGPRWSYNFETQESFT